MNINFPRFCCFCDFYNFNQVYQCDKYNETCKWLLSLNDKANKWDKYGLQDSLLKLTRIEEHLEEFPIYEQFVDLPPIRGITREFQWALAVSKWLNGLKEIITVVTKQRGEEK